MSIFAVSFSPKLLLKYHYFNFLKSVKIFHMYLCENKIRLKSYRTKLACLPLINQVTQSRNDFATALIVILIRIMSGLELATAIDISAVLFFLFVTLWIVAMICTRQPLKDIKTTLERTPNRVLNSDHSRPRLFEEKNPVKLLWLRRNGTKYPLKVYWMVFPQR